MSASFIQAAAFLSLRREPRVATSQGRDGRAISRVPRMLWRWPSLRRASLARVTSGHMVPTSAERIASVTCSGVVAPPMRWYCA